MQINANLPAGIDRFALRAAGLEVEGVLELEHDVDAGRATLPKTLRSIYIADPAVRVVVTVLGFGEGDNIDRWRDKSGRIAFKRVRRGETPTRVRIEIDNAKAGKAIGENLAFYSFENDGELVWWKEHSETWHCIDTVLHREGLSHDKLDRGECPIPRRAIEGLIELAGKLDPQRRNNVHGVLSRQRAKKDRPLVAACLIEEFEREPMLDDQLSTRIYEVAGPGNADDLIRLIKDGRYGDDRWPLCLALARTKHPDAADTIASILGQGVNTRGKSRRLPNSQRGTRREDPEISPRSEQRCPASGEEDIAEAGRRLRRPRRGIWSRTSGRIQSRCRSGRRTSIWTIWSRR